MDISVVIPAHNEERYIGACIESILRHKTAALHEIVVVDNASTDRTAELAGSYPLVRVVKEPAKGLTRAREAGRNAAQGELLAYVDADSLVPANWFTLMEQEFSANPRLVCLSGPCDYYDLPSWKKVVVRTYWRIAHSLSFATRALVMGSNFVVRRVALDAIGGFDTSIEFYGEDTNIARRLREQGTVKFLPSFRVSSSARRFHGQGMLTTGTVYVLNFFSEFFLHRPVTRKYKDYR